MINLIIVYYIVKAELLNYTGGFVTKERGQSVKFNCTADGNPRPYIVWRKNGQLLLNTSRVKIVSLEYSNTFHSNVTPGVLQLTSVLTITDLTGNDNGNYFCQADNKAYVGAVLTTPYELKVMERKLIYTH